MALIKVIDLLLPIQRPDRNKHIMNLMAVATSCLVDIDICGAYYTQKVKSEIKVVK